MGDNEDLKYQTMLIFLRKLSDKDYPKKIDHSSGILTIETKDFKVELNVTDFGDKMVKAVVKYINE